MSLIHRNVVLTNLLTERKHNFNKHNFMKEWYFTLIQFQNHISDSVVYQEKTNQVTKRTLIRSAVVKQKQIFKMMLKWKPVLSVSALFKFDILLLLACYHMLFISRLLHQKHASGHTGSYLVKQRQVHAGKPCSDSRRGRSHHFS